MLVFRLDRQPVAVAGVAEEHVHLAVLAVDGLAHRQLAPVVEAERQADGSDQPLELRRGELERLHPLREQLAFELGERQPRGLLGR